MPGTKGSSPEAASPHRRAHRGRRGAGGSGCSRDKAAGQPQPPGTRGPGQAMPATPRDGAERAARGLRHLSPSERGKSFSWSLGHGQDCPLSRGPSPGSAVGCPHTWGKPGGRGLGHPRGTGWDGTQEVRLCSPSSPCLCRSDTFNSLAAHPCFHEGPNPWNKQLGGRILIGKTTAWCCGEHGTP